MREGNIIIFNMKIHFTLKTPSLPMQQSVTNLWEGLNILQVFGFSVGFLVVWERLCVWKVGGLFLCLVWLLIWWWGGSVAICWRRNALRKCLKQETGKFSKIMSVPFLPSGLSIQASQVLDYPSIWTVVVAPSPFRLFSS